MISMIAAYARHRVIGMNGAVPWRLPADSRYFQRTTMGHTVVMGRKTFDSINQQPLPKRRNVVITNSSTFTAPGVEIVHSAQDVLALDDPGEVFIIGGSYIYQLFLERADRLYITTIDLEVEGDTFFPAWNPADFTLLSQKPGRLDARNTLPYTFFIYERKRPQHS
jgi:dihydrofolate reductase